MSSRTSRSSPQGPFHIVPSEPEKPESTRFCVRVKLCSTEEDCNKRGHEIMVLDAESDFAELRKNIQDHFQGVLFDEDAARINLKGATWKADDKIVKVKAIYAGGSQCGSQWDSDSDGVGETILTRANCQNTLNMLKEWKGVNWGFLCVVIAPAPAQEGF